MTIKELRLRTNLSQRKFAAKYHIPFETLIGWEQPETSTRHRGCPAYVIYMLARLVELDFDVSCLNTNESPPESGGRAMKEEI